MQAYEANAVVEVIEQLVAELGVDSVPSEIDVEGALKIMNEVLYGSEEEGPEVALEDPVLASVDADLEEKDLAGVE